MELKNKLGLEGLEFQNEEERISKQKAKKQSLFSAAFRTAGLQMRLPNAWGKGCPYADASRLSLPARRIISRMTMTRLECTGCSLNTESALTGSA